MEDQEEKEGNGLIANVVQLIILFWSLGVISWSYFNPNPTRQIDTTFAAGLLSAVSAQFGLNIKKGGNGDKKKLQGKVNIVDNKNNKVCIKLKNYFFSYFFFRYLFKRAMSTKSRHRLKVWLMAAIRRQNGLVRPIR